MRSVSSMVMAPARTGSDNRSRNTVIRMDQTKSGILCMRHAGGTHVENGGDEVDGAQDRRCAGEMDGKNCIIHGGARLARGGKRRIKRPATTYAKGARRAFSKHGDQQQAESRRQQPERNIVHARERHVGRADHQRHEPVAKTANHRGHDHEEDHEQAVAGDKHVIHVLALIERCIGSRAISHLGQARKNLDAGLGQFNAHHDREEAANEP